MSTLQQFNNIIENKQYRYGLSPSCFIKDRENKSYCLLMSIATMYESHFYTRRYAFIKKNSYFDYYQSFTRSLSISNARHKRSTTSSTGKHETTCLPFSSGSIVSPVVMTWLAMYWYIKPTWSFLVVINAYFPNMSGRISSRGYKESIISVSLNP